MIKRIGIKDDDSQAEDAGTSSEMDELSDIDEDNLDRELELKDVDDVLNSNKALSHKEKHELGKIRAKLLNKQDKQRITLKSIVAKNLIHPNERPRKTKYINKHRTLVFASRGINQRMRHLMNDFKDLLPHSKSEPKYADKRSLAEIQEICVDRNCNNCIFLESRRHTDLYMWIARAPDGPSMKFYVTNVHTMAELRLTGNCLKSSRPFLVFDAAFNKSSEYRLMKEMFIQVFGTPNGHPLSKPFLDHVFLFSLVGHKVWFRNYQVVYDADHNKNNEAKNDPILIEIGPRLVLHPIRIQQGCFQGSIIYQCGEYVSPNAQRRAVKKQKQLISSMKTVNDFKKQKVGKRDRGRDYFNRTVNKLVKKQYEGELFEENTTDPMDDVFRKGVNFEGSVKKRKVHSNPSQHMDVDKFLGS